MLIISPISNSFIDFTFAFETSFPRPLLLFFYPRRFQGRMISWHIKLLVLGPPKWQHIESFLRDYSVSQKKNTPISSLGGGGLAEGISRTELEKNLGMRSHYSAYRLYVICFLQALCSTSSFQSTLYLQVPSLSSLSQWPSILQKYIQLVGL